MKLSHIRDVLAVSESGSLRAAGRQLGVAQPAITRSIREIEHELGACLFERHAKGVRLTPIGEAFVRRASVVQNELRRAKDEVEQLRGQDVGQVSAVMSIAASIAILPRALAAFRKAHPAALLRVSEGLFQPVERDIIDGRIDFYAGALNAPVSDPRLVVERLFANQRLIVARTGHPLLKASSIEELGAAHWLRPALTDRSTEADFAGWLREMGLPSPKVVMHTRSALQTVLAVAASDLLTVVPRQWLELPELAGRLEALPAIPPVSAAPVCMVRQSAIPLTPLAERFSDIVRRVAGHYARAHPVEETTEKVRIVKLGRGSR